MADVVVVVEVDDEFAGADFLLDPPPLEVLFATGSGLDVAAPRLGLEVDFFCGGVSAS